MWLSRLRKQKLGMEIERILSTVTRLTDYQTVRKHLETNLHSFRDTVEKLYRRMTFSPLREVSVM